VETPATLAPGDVFDRYEIQAVVGEGGMGRVYRAFDRRLARVVALKVVRAGKGDTDGAIRMVREARAAAALNHPNAVAVFDAGEHEGMAYIAMELVPGRSLRRIVEDASISEVPIDLRVRWLADVARALAAAHAKGLMHRDVKPENVVVRDDGVVKVLDFGIARRFAVVGATTAGQGDTITQDGTLVGTPLYMAPEQLSGDAIDQRVDQFAWGVLAYELLTGARPWAANDVRAIAAILQQRAHAPSERAPGIAPHVDATILRALEKKPAQRFASMDELLASFQGQPMVATTVPAPAGADADSSRDVVSPKAETTTARTPSRWPRAALGAAGLALALVAAVITWGPFGSRSRAFAPTHPIASASASAEPQIELRRSIAVLGLRDRAARADAGAWRSTAITELLGAQLAAGEHLRVVTGERVARARIELGIGDDAALTPQALTKLAKNLGADLVVTGDIVPAEAGALSLAFEITLVDAKSGNVLAAVSDEGREGDLFAIAARIATSLRAKIGVDEPAPTEHAVAGSSLPEDAEAARLYAEAIDQQHHFHEARAIQLFGEATKLAPNFALGHAHAAESLAHLGHADEAKVEAKRALDLSAGLPREDRLWIEATYHAAAHELDDATRTYQALFTFFPDNVDYAAGMLQAMSFAGHPQDALKEIERLRRMPPAISEDPRIDYEEARATHLTNDYERCLRAAEDCRRRAQARGNLLIYAKAGFADGVARISLGHADDGLRVLGESRDLAVSLGDTYTAHVLEGPMAGEYEKRGDLVRARAVLEGSQAGLIAVGNLYWATSASEQIGWLDVEQGHVEQGRRKIEAAIAYYRHAQQPHALEGGLHALGEIVASQGDPGAGAALANESKRLAESSGRKNTVAGAELSLAFIAHVAGDTAAEQQHEARALVLAQANKYESGEARARHLIGEREWAAGDLAGARRDLEAALHEREGLGQRMDAAESRLALARVTLDEGRATDAETITRDTLTVFEPAHAASLQAQALALLACERAALGARADADRFGAQASAIAMDDVWGKRRVRIDLARVPRLMASADQ
jgi:serine/threonine protein kinase/tetratricopeptide (TPR) repeat protein